MLPFELLLPVDRFGLRALTFLLGRMTRGLLTEVFTGRIRIARINEQVMAFNIYNLYRIIQPGFRGRRIRLFLERLQPSSTTRIDVGGYPFDWEGIVPIKSPITCLNVAYPPMQTFPERFQCLTGDGCRMEFSDKAFDILFSNSVIEHVGSYENQKRFAAEVRRVGKKVFIQTPNRWFFVEPHFGVAFVHFLPWPLAKRLLRIFSFRAWFRKGDNVDLKQLADELRLLTFREVKELFPDCEIIREKWFGLTKSFVAVRA